MLYKRTCASRKRSQWFGSHFHLKSQKPPLPKYGWMLAKIGIACLPFLSFCIHDRITCVNELRWTIISTKLNYSVTLAGGILWDPSMKIIGFSIINHPFWGIHIFWKHPYGMWECPTSAFSWLTEKFPRHSYMACTNRVNPFTRSLKHFPLGLLIAIGSQNKVFLGRIFRMATVSYCLSLLKCSYSYSLFDRFWKSRKLMIQRELEQCTHTQTNKHNGWNGKDWYIRLKGLQYLGWTYFLSSNHLLPCYLMLLTLLPGRLLILSGSEQCVVWQFYCEFPSRRHIQKKNKVYVRGCIKDGDLFTRYSDVCWLILKNTRFFRRFSVIWWVIPLYQLAVSWGTKTNHGWLMRTPLLLANVYYVCFWVFDSAG